MAISRIDVRSILRELVSVPSVHPEADPGATRPGEAAAAAWMAKHLKSLGAGVEIHEIDPGRPTVVADPDGKVAAMYREIARKTAVAVAQKAEDFSARFPSIVIQNT
jgi:acetylornithine deacetylase/succinyl-diaminopimelate desuccinylase-like protein